jgi:hypothetical protein
MPHNSNHTGSQPRYNPNRVKEKERVDGDISIRFWWGRAMAKTAKQPSKSKRKRVKKRV